MTDTRIAQARALTDDARTALADLMDDIPYAEWQVRLWIQEAQKKLNGALLYMGKIQ